MFIVIFTIGFIVMPHTIYCMLQQKVNAQSTTIHRTPTSTSSTEYDYAREKESTATQQTSNHAKEDPFAKAIQEGDLALVRKHFESYNYWTIDWNYYHTDIANSLSYAVQFPQTKTADVVHFLLQRADCAFIEQPQSVLEKAARNGHITVVPFFEKYQGKKFTQDVLSAAISSGDIQVVQSLLQGGVSVNPKTYKSDVTPIEKALTSFSMQDDKPMLEKRIAIIRHLLAKMSLEQVHIPNNLQLPKWVSSKVKAMLREKQIPTQLSMQDDIEPNKNYEHAERDAYIAIGAFVVCPLIAVGPLVCCLPDEQKPKRKR